MSNLEHTDNMSANPIENLSQEATTEQLSSPEEQNEARNPYLSRSMSELVEDMQAVVDSTDFINQKSNGEAIRRAFYSKLNESHKENEGNEEIAKANGEIEAKFKELLNVFSKKKSEANAHLAEERNKNLKLKKDILDKLEALTNSADDLSETIPDFRKLQQEWKAIGEVPAEEKNNIWKAYSKYQDKFYDLIKINRELREYDFKKNLELKLALCVAAEKLDEETNPVTAFNTLQKLHEEWRDVGPVAKEEREAIWARFKEASTKINKKHVAHFEAVKAKEEENLKLKTAICERIEAIDLSSISTRQKWEEITEQIMAMQAEWRTIGYATKKTNTSIFKRFREACDNFFKHRNQFFKDVRAEFSQKIDAKKSIIAEVEALKEVATDHSVNIVEKIKDLQQRWKEVGFTPKKQGDVLWERFREACDSIFEARQQGSKAEEEANTILKKELIEKARAYELTGNREDDIAALKAIQEEFNAVGYVNVSERKVINKEFKDIVDSKFDTIFGRNHGEKSSKGGKVSSEHLRRYNELKKEIAAYENNILFLNSSSKKGNSIVEELHKKVDALKAKLAELAEHVK